MTIKQSKDGGDDELVQETMADRLKKVQTETWRKMRYVHDESADAWAVSEEVLYVDDAAKGKDVETGGGGHAVAALADKVAALRTGWREVSMLETTSGIQNPERGVKVEISDDETPAAGAGGAGAPGKGKGKGKAHETGAGGASKAAGKAKVTASSSTTNTRGKRPATTTTTTNTNNNTAKAGPSTRAKKSKS